MKKSFFTRIPFMLSAVALSATLLLSSCGKDDDPKAENENETEIPTEYSELNVEQNKAKLEDNGIELINNLTQFKNTSGIKTSIAFSGFLDESSLPEGGRVKSNRAVSLMQALAAFGKGNKSAAELAAGFRAQEDGASLDEEYQDLVGIYTYNATTDEWSLTETGNDIVFRFPSTDEGTTNDAEFRVFNFTNKVIANSSLGEHPTSLNAELKVGGSSKLAYAFTASYNNDGDPTEAKTSVTVDAFTISFEAKNTTSEASAKYALTSSGKNLLSFGFGAKGTFTQDDIEESGEEVVTSADAYFQIMNIKFGGEINAEKLFPALENANTEAEVVAAYNAHYKLVVFYADSKKKIADSEFYVKKAETQWDEDQIDVRLVFADGSKSDLENYTETGFSEIESEFEEFVDSL